MQKFNARLVDYYMDKGGDDVVYMLRKMGASELLKEDPHMQRYLRELLIAQQNVLNYFLVGYCEVQEDD